MSDQASTQKRFNHMVHQKIDDSSISAREQDDGSGEVSMIDGDVSDNHGSGDIGIINDDSTNGSDDGNACGSEKDSTVSGESNQGNQSVKNKTSLHELFCGMHVGVNLRAAHVNAIQSDGTVGIDRIVHSMWKLLGHLGSHPEYGKGVQAFPEFLKCLLDEAHNLDGGTEEVEDIKASLQVKLERQVGSRYFVTSRNAGRLFYLQKWIKKFLEQLKIVKSLNKLEVAVLTHINTESDLALLKLDGLLFDKIYADMMELKSKFLGKSYLSLNTHYLELLEYLKLLVENPKLIIDPNYRVFTSEPKLYEDKKVDHRQRKNYLKVRTRLYTSDAYDEYMFQLVKKAADSMAKKLMDYKADQLPGGRFWNPADNSLKNVLHSLPPTNDVAESILGLNDWLFKRNPNFKQRTVSTLVEVMKNSSMKWFRQQEEDTRDRIKKKEERGRSERGTGTAKSTTSKSEKLPLRKR